MASQGGELEGYSIILFVAFAPHLFAFLSQSNTKTVMVMMDRTPKQKVDDCAKLLAYNKNEKVSLGQQVLATGIFEPGKVKMVASIKLLNFTRD